MAIPFLKIGEVIISGITKSLLKKVAKAKSQVFIDKMTDHIIDIFGSKIINALKRKAEETDTKFDDGLVEVLEAIFNTEEDK